MVKFAFTILYVPDVEVTLSFYEKAFGLKRKFISPDNDYGELNTGDVTLSFASTRLGKSNLPGGFTESSLQQQPFGFEIAFSTADVEKTVKEAIAAGAIEEAKAKTKPWGQTVAYVKDINGFLIEICTPV